MSSNESYHENYEDNEEYDDSSEINEINQDPIAQNQNQNEENKLKNSQIRNCFPIDEHNFIFAIDNKTILTSEKYEIKYSHEIDYHPENYYPSYFIPEISDGELFIQTENEVYRFDFLSAQKQFTQYSIRTFSVSNQLFVESREWTPKIWQKYKNEWEIVEQSEFQSCFTRSWAGIAAKTYSSENKIQFVRTLNDSNKRIEQAGTRVTFFQAGLCIIDNSRSLNVIDVFSEKRYKFNIFDSQLDQYLVPTDVGLSLSNRTLFRLMGKESLATFLMNREEHYNNFKQLLFKNPNFPMSQLKEIMNSANESFDYQIFGLKRYYYRNQMISLHNEVSNNRKCIDELKSKLWQNQLLKQSMVQKILFIEKRLCDFI